MKKSHFWLLLLSILCLLSTFNAKKKKIESDDTSTPTVKHTSKAKEILIVENIPEKFTLNTSNFKTY